MDKFVKKYIELLNESNSHLNGEIISTYINFYDNLSNKEKEVVENHLSECKECLKNFNKIFDEDFEFDEAQKLNFHQIESSENQKKYEDSEGKVEILFKKDKSRIFLKFLRLPENLKKQNFRITGNSVLRIISAQEDKQYHFQDNISFEDLNEIEVYYLKIFDNKKEKPAFSFSKYYGYAAAAIIIVSLMIGYFYFSPPRKNDVIANKNKQAIDSSLADKKPLIETDTLKIEEENNLIAQNTFNPEDFEENTILESFLNRNIRSAKNIEIISPANGDTIKGKVELRWKSTLPAGKYQIIIVNNKNQKVWETITQKKQTEVQKKLSPGLYYWKILYKNEMKKLGKFVVK